jgi:hypothetical protein
LAGTPVGEAVLVDDGEAGMGNGILDSSAVAVVVAIVVVAIVVFNVATHPPEVQVIHLFGFPERRACMRTIPCRGDSNFMAK